MGEQIPGQVKVATLHSEPTSRYGAVYLSLVCLDVVPAAYITPYDSAVPIWVDGYAIGIWDILKGEWADGNRLNYQNLTVTDDGGSIYILNRVQIRQLLGILAAALEEPNPNRGLIAGMDSSQNTDRVGLGGWFDVTGFEAARTYLGCFEGIG